jgi:hypothetical protein
MPTKRRNLRKLKKNVFSQTHYHCLQTGFVHVDCDGLSVGSLWSSDRLQCELAGAWQFLAPQLLKEWIHVDPDDRYRYGAAGSRPAAWWVYDAPERRRCLNGTHPHDDPTRQAKINEIENKYPHRSGDFDHLFYGCPNSFMVPADFTRVYESQFEYLKRLGLLFDGEEALYHEQQRRVAECERRKREEQAEWSEDQL